MSLITPGLAGEEMTERDQFRALVGRYRAAGIEALQEALNNPALNHRQAAAHALGEQVVGMALGGRAREEATPRTSLQTVNLWLRALRDSEAAVRRHAVRPLAGGANRPDSGPDPGLLLCVVEGLVHRLRDNDALVRSSAAEALGGLPCQQAVRPLLHLLEDPAPSVCISAACALVRSSTGEPDHERGRREPVVRLNLAESEWNAIVRALAQALRHEEPTVRHKAIQVLGKMVRTDNDEAERALLLALDHRDPVVRAEAARGLGKPARAANVWHRALRLQDEELRRRTVEDLLWPELA